MYIKIIATGIFAAVMAGHALADVPRTVPIYLSEDGHILTDAMVNGDGPYTFIVDTAAHSTVVFDDFSEEANLAELPTSQQIQVQGATGITEARLVEVGDVQMGQWAFTISRAISLPSIDHMGDVAGVLGLSELFAQPVGFALGKGQLDIYDADEAIGPAAELEGEWFAIELERRSGRFMWTTIAVNGVDIEAVIDTGARRSVINTAGAEAISADIDFSTLDGDEPIRGATDDMAEAWVLPVATVQLGERAWGGRQLTLSNPAIFRAMGRETTPTVIFGADFLAEQNFIIDPAENVLWMEKRQSAALGYLVRPTTELSSAVY